MKKTLISFFTLLLFAAAATTTATAQDTKPKLAVLVVGMDDWRIGDVLAHLVGEELNRGKTYDVVTRRNDVQNKLEALRRGTDKLDEYLLCTWATGLGISMLCLVTTPYGLNFSLKLLDASSGMVHCSESSVEPNAVLLKQLAWSLTGSIDDVCTPTLEDYTDPSIGMKMVYVEGGTFTMGCLSGRDNLDGNSCSNDEYPSHSVTVGNFWIGKYEVTQGQWKAVMGTTIQQQAGSSLYGVGTNFPMYNVSWNEAKAFCDALSARTGKAYRLPTEEEWEYAARGGKSSLGYVYSGGNYIGSVAWYDDNANGASHAVGGKLGNELGIHDMTGNVGELCSNYWRDDYSASESTSYRVFRGDSWYRGKSWNRIAVRSYGSPNSRDYTVGFRVV
jgi:formylglycine-generating enzyme required for sulfatase activity